MRNEGCVIFWSPRESVVIKCSLRGCGQRSKKEAKPSSQQHIAAEPSRVECCRKSARHPVIRPKRHSLAAKIVRLSGRRLIVSSVCGFNRAHRHRRLRNRCSSDKFALLSQPLSQTSRSFFGGYRGIGFCVCQTLPLAFS
ncbi:hypothetical protein QBC40DRAFT_9709 [Triangularia verruculosa]|uniref:Uncharacterized protein n=1 Tax=Triangularia verruculosa TaxID=2587418 RepID=A0AAN6X9I5_9PEZI|nr:hypothetical protein QBC40DRAFT_9709 [Triangularia verruculosa]